MRWLMMVALNISISKTSHYKVLSSALLEKLEMMESNLSVLFPSATPESSLCFVLVT